MLALLHLHFDEQKRWPRIYLDGLLAHLHLLTIPRLLAPNMSSPTPISRPETPLHRDINSEIKLQLLAVQLKDNQGRIHLLERQSKCKARFAQDPWLHDACSQRIATIDKFDPSALRARAEEMLSALKEEDFAVPLDDVCLFFMMF